MRKRKYIYAGLWALVVTANIAEWRSRSFCDFHVKYLLPLSLNVYGRLTSLFPFSVGEWMLAAAVFLALFFLVLSVALLVKSLKKRRRTAGEPGPAGRAGFWEEKRKRRVRSFYRFTAWLVLIVCIVMTWDCSLLYHASSFEQRYMPEMAGAKFSDEEVAWLRNHIVTQANALAEKLPRNEDGMLDYTLYSSSSISEDAIPIMQDLGGTYDLLQGYYPKAKPLFHSHFLSQQNMAGYYFPFSMEANYNAVMYVSNTPATICHELSHLKGFLFEDDANMTAYLACVQSDNDFFAYSGYLSVLGYVERVWQKNVKGDPAGSGPEISDLVKRDYIFLTAEAWEETYEKTILPTETVKKASTTFTDSVLKANGVEEGMKSYSGVVQLLLEYYRKTE